MIEKLCLQNGTMSLVWFGLVFLDRGVQGILLTVYRKNSWRDLGGPNRMLLFGGGVSLTWRYSGLAYDWLCAQESLLIGLGDDKSGDPSLVS